MARCWSRLPGLRAQVGEQPIRIIFPFAAGGSGDALARLIAEHLRTALNQPVIVENRTGAQGRIGVQAVKAAAPDGKTLLLTPVAPMSVYQHVYKSLAYDPVADFEPISQVATFDFGLAVGPQVPAKSLKELVAWVKANPSQGQLRHAGRRHAAAFLRRLRSPAPPGSTCATSAIAARPRRSPTSSAAQIPIVVTTTSDLLEQHKGGRIRVLATSDAAALAVPARCADLQGGRLRHRGHRLVRGVRAGQDAARYGRAPERCHRRRRQDAAGQERLLAFGLQPTGTTRGGAGRDPEGGLGAVGACRQGLRLHAGTIAALPQAGTSPCQPVPSRAMRSPAPIR